MSTRDDHVQEWEEVIPSDTAAGQSVQERIIQLLESLRYDERDVFGVRLAIEEALVNAIKEQQAQIAAQQKLLNQQQQEIDALKRLAHWAVRTPPRRPAKRK